MRKILRTAAALALAGCMMTANVFAATAFTDVPSNYWGKTFIDQAAGAGLVSGMGDGTYGINGKLSSAQFTTMVCNLICKDDVTTYSNTYKPAEWWYSYMAVAYNKGFLKNTTVGDARAANNAWSASSVNAEISRYDMAQIMVNVANSKGWSMPSTLEILSAQLKIGDWSKIPAKYQNAVATAYAKGYLSGMDNVGTFAGDQSMTRTHGAVVICKLLNENKSSSTTTTPSYTNTTKLVNGKEATQSNVIDALDDLKTEFPRNMAWNATKVYTSQVLGATFGADAYAYTISDRIFGNFKAEKADVEDMKAGDLLYLNALKCHVIVTEVDGDDFYYTGCGSNGKIYWGESGDIDDLTYRDVLYTRYEGSGSGSSSNKLSDGKSATESNVKDLIDDFLYYEYDVGDDWNETYKSTAFGHRNKKSGSEAFACYLSDYIFEDLDVESVDDFDDLRAGDVIELYDEEEWVIVTKVSGDTIYYLGVDSDDEVYEDNLDVDDLDIDEDWGYTRYPVDDDDDNDGELSNGKSVTESNVKDLIDDFLYEKYSEGDKWEATYKSTAFGHKSRKGGSEGFVCYLSDYVFGNLEVEDVDDFDDLRAGDVIELYDEEEWVIVTKVSGDTIDYLGISGRSKVYSGEMDVDELDSDDYAYTRYPSGGSSSDDDIDEYDVEDLITQFYSKKYDIGEYWDMDQTYKSSQFYSRSVTGNRAFAYYFSDYLFGDLSVKAADGNEVDIYDIRLGDVVMLDGGDDENTYLVVTEVDDRADEFSYVYVNANGKVRSGSMDVDDLVYEDTVYTRYPD